MNEIQLDEPSVLNESVMTSDENFDELKKATNTNGELLSQI